MKRKILVTLLALFMLVGLVKPSMAYDDVKIESLMDRGWVEGRDNNNLALDDTITRAEFIKIIVLAEGLEEEAESLRYSQSNFVDVGLDHWANGYINASSSIYFINGYPDKTFRPDNNITYEEVLTILARLYPGFKEREIGKNETWSKQFIDFALDYGFLSDINVYNYSHNAKRGDTFEIIYNAYNRPDYEPEEIEYKGLPLLEIYSVARNVDEKVLNKLEYNLEIIDTLVKTLELNPSQENIDTVQRTVDETVKILEELPDYTPNRDKLIYEIKTKMQPIINKAQVKAKTK